MVAGTPGVAASIFIPSGDGGPATSSGSKIRMEISATRARVVIPDATFEGGTGTDGLRFRIEPAREKDLESIESLATADPLVLEAARGGTVETVGRPMTIGSNATGGGYEAILPLTGAPLNDEQLKRVAVFAWYDDGTKELARGSIVPYDGEDRLGIRFPVSAGKTGTGFPGRRGWALGEGVH